MYVELKTRFRKTGANTFVLVKREDAYELNKGDFEEARRKPRVNDLAKMAEGINVTNIGSGNQHVHRR
jgi:hypothetical protein